ncbi:MAG: DNA-binding response regulator [Arcobacter sp.]|nr:MAG: DNA-binding response regulator [Arcobacter sp.]
MKKNKILIVEDESIIALEIKKVLISLDLEVTDCVRNYTNAINSVIDNSPDIILMDIKLNNSKDGIETAQDIQKIENIPILYLTSYSDEETLSRAAKTNPIGYLLKPFNRDELKSNILLTLYKIEQSVKANIENKCRYLGFNYYYDLESEILFYDSHAIKISSNEKKLLTILVGAKGNIVSFDEIEYYIWPDSTVSNGALRTLLYRLRAKLEYKIIETIPSTGCKLVPPI